MSIDAHQLPGAIQWHEGMLLSPQHFQQMALRFEGLIHYRTQLVAPFSWGVTRLTLDPILLVNGTFRVLDLNACMPDGIVISHSAEFSELQADLTPHAAAMKAEPQTVHLCVPVHRVDAASIASGLARYDSVEAEPVVDQNTGEGEIHIPRLRPRIFLLVGEAPSAKYVSFPLARVGFRNEMFVLTDYIHPTLAVSLQSPLGVLCSQVALRLREKARYLSDELLTRYYDMGVSAVLENKSKLQCLVEALPLLEANLYTGVSHPISLYMALCMVAGHVASLGSSMIPPVLPPYDHNDLRTTFETVKEFIFKMIDEGIWESHFVIPFHLHQETFSLRIEESWMKTPMLVGVRGAPEVTEKDIMTWMQEALIGSESKIQSLRERRILGASRQRLDDDSAVAARGLMLFTIGNERDNVVPNELLQILNLTEKKDAVTEVLLLVPKDRVK